MAIVKSSLNSTTYVSNSVLSFDFLNLVHQISVFKSHILLNLFHIQKNLKEVFSLIFIKMNL